MDRNAGSGLASMGENLRGGNEGVDYIVFVFRFLSVSAWGCRGRVGRG